MASSQSENIEPALNRSLPAQTIATNQEATTSEQEAPNREQFVESDIRLLRDKMKEMFARIITDIDNQVLTVSESQSELDSQLDRLIKTLDSIRIDEKLTDEMSANAKRISSLKTRLTLVHTILSNSSARCCRTLEAVSSYNVLSRK